MPFETVQPALSEGVFPGGPPLHSMRACITKGCPSIFLSSARPVQVKGIPFLVFDAGGVLEMFDSKEFSDNVVFEPTLAALKRKLAHVVERGRIKTVQLAEHITTGRQQWLQWHADFAESLPRLIQAKALMPPLLRLLPSCIVSAALEDMRAS